VRTGIRTFIFSSTAAVYGNAEAIPLHEDVTPAPSILTAAASS
jgi:UDP-glucose 4-epimerase